MKTSDCWILPISLNCLNNKNRTAFAGSLSNRTSWKSFIKESLKCLKITSMRRVASFPSFAANMSEPLGCANLLLTTLWHSRPLIKQLWLERKGSYLRLRDRPKIQVILVSSRVTTIIPSLIFRSIRPNLRIILLSFWLFLHLMTCRSKEKMWFNSLKIFWKRLGWWPTWLIRSLRISTMHNSWLTCSLIIRSF